MYGEKSFTVVEEAHKEPPMVRGFATAKPLHRMRFASQIAEDAQQLEDVLNWLGDNTYHVWEVDE